MRRSRNFTVEQLDNARARIEAQGITIKQWSEERGLAPRIVVAVLNGNLRGIYGESHRASVLLGLKNEKI